MLDIKITDDPFTVNVLVVGPSGAGKTVYLASMFKFLGTQGKEVGMYLSANQATRVLLADIYKQVADPKVEWPESTCLDDSREYVLDCRTKFKGNSHSILQVRYFDYAGELLTDNIDDNRALNARVEIERRAREAQSVLCFLDGRRLARLIQGEEDGLQHFHVRMSPVFSLLQDVEKPIHFVIIKWDLLCDLREDEAASLQLVRNKLLEIREFGNLKDNAALPHKDAAPAIRLIPVSAVGPEYVTPLPDGLMKKISGRVPQPQYVEMPFLAILPDLFSSVLGKLDVEDRKMLIKIIRSETRMTAQERARWLVGILGDKINKVIVGAVKTVVGGKSIDKVSAAAVDALTAALRERGDFKLATREKELGQIDRLTEEAATARRIALDQMTARLKAFERTLPASVLRKSDEA
jgi:hypothetical protein